MIQRSAVSQPSSIVSVGEITARSVTLGSGVPSRQEMAMSLVSRSVSEDWNFFISPASFDFRTVASRKRVYLRRLTF